ncbi:MAG: hypothetical protein PHE49_05185 [bacterium]|nr:hypothetical protein [bacterium]
MEKENWSRMVNLTFVKQTKLILLTFVALFISTEINAVNITCLYNVRGGKLFKMTITTTNPIANGRPFTFKTKRSSDGGSTFGGDILGQLVPAGGQFGVVNGVVDSTQLNKWEGNVSYNYKRPYGQKTDYIRIFIWTSCPGNVIVEDSVDIVVNNFDNDGIKVDCNPITSKDFDKGSGIKITIYPIPKGIEVPVVKIFDAFGYVVKTFSTEEIMKYYQVNDSLYGVVYWNGRNEKGNKVSNGVYQICAQMIKGEEAEIWRRKIAVSR